MFSGFMTPLPQFPILKKFNADISTRETKFDRDLRPYALLSLDIDVLFLKFKGFFIELRCKLKEFARVT